MQKMPGKVQSMMTDRALSDEEIKELDELESTDPQVMSKEQLSRYRELQMRMEMAGEHYR
jgi:hypothetical protein